MLPNSAAPCTIKVVWFSDSWECRDKPMDVHIYMYICILYTYICACFAPNISTNQRSVHYALMHWWKTPQTSKFFASKLRMKTGFLTRFLVQPRLCSPLLGLPNFSGAVGPPWRFVDLHPWSWHTIYDLWSICIWSYNTCTTPFDHKLFFKWCAMPMTIPFVIVVDWQIFACQINMNEPKVEPACGDMQALNLAKSEVFVGFKGFWPIRSNGEIVPSMYSTCSNYYITANCIPYNNIVCQAFPSFLRLGIMNTGMLSCSWGCDQGRHVFLFVWVVPSF